MGLVMGCAAGPQPPRGAAGTGKQAPRKIRRRDDSTYQLAPHLAM